MAVFLAISALGIYALGRGLTGLFEPRGAVNLGWLAVAAVAVLILFSQMGRVHDSWPYRNDIEGGRTRPTRADDDATSSPLAISGEQGDGTL